MRYLCTYCLMNAELNSYICQVTGAKTARKLETIQSLWSGYGDIRRVILEGAERNTLIVKAISIETKNQHPRGWDGAIGHQRKLNSYEVETYWYKHWNNQCNKQCRTPLFLGYLSTEDYQYILMEDLDKVFPFRKEVLVTAELQACLTWLAEFHATFMLQQPTGIWEQGSYWHLDTRPEEWENIEEPNVKEKASWINEELKNAKYKTIIHGDAKLANFCFGKKAGKVALDLRKIGLTKEIKSDNTPVSNGDVEVNKILTNKIKEITPNIVIVSEESASHKMDNDLNNFWLIDPIDGTKDYISNRDEFTLNASLIINKNSIKKKRR